VIEVISETEGLVGLRDEWGELLASSAARSPFLTWEWLYPWWKHLADKRRLHVVAVRSEGRLIALAPFTLAPPDVRRLLPMQRLEMLGSGTVGSDYLDVIVRDGHRDDALPALAEHLERSGHMLWLENVLRGDTAIGALANGGAPRGWRVRERPALPCPYVRLEGHSFESYLSARSTAHRRTFRRKAQHARTRLGATFEVANTASQRAEHMRIWIELHKRRFDGRAGGSDALGSAAVEAFHDEATQLAMERGWLRLYVLRLSGTPVAALYGFMRDRVFYFYQSGFDPAHADSSVGLIAMGWSIERAIDEGALEYDMLHGPERYKLHWADRVREVRRVELYPPGRHGGLMRSAVDYSIAARRAARMALAYTRRIHIMRGKSS
jgi:CelD/BcsL family acetyltransferase involved in cellulose biosynthesis